jgi:hypothetical protein
MGKYRNASMYFLATLFVALLVGCGQEVVNVPTVISTVPSQGSAGVAINTVISATFSMPMNSSTISASTFVVTTADGTAVAGAVSYSGSVATFTPGTVLAYETVYTATVTTGAKNPGGTPLRANYVWSFTTIGAPPAVISTIPANGAINVPVGQMLSATFSQAMSPATISAASFTVSGPGGVAVAGAVSYSGVVATFTPATNLGYDTLYTATVTNGATNAAGIPLLANYAWTFTTITPPPIVVSTIPLNTSTGVPVSQLVSATFNEAMSCSTLASPAASFTLTGPGATPVAGTVGCAGSVATLTSAANLKVNTIYTATISTGAKSLAGTAMAANYSWTFRTLPAPTPPTVISTAPMNLATSVPINQALSAIFSTAMDPAAIDAMTFTLAGPGATPVTGVVSYVVAGAVATLKPSVNLAPNTVYTATITTGSKDLVGIAMAQNFVWTFTTGAASVTISPTVIATVPLNAATNVPINLALSATFSEAMNGATINATTFKLTGQGGAPVSGLVAYAAIANTLTFTPSANLATNTLFTATITTGAQDLAGNALAANYVWSFTTGMGSLVVAPELERTVPANAATNVPLNQAVSTTFTEAMDPLTITNSTFELMQSGTAIPAAITYDAINFIATLTPLSPLTANTTYVATVTAGATDLAGNPLGNTGAPNPWSFTTGLIAVPPPIVLGPAILHFGGFGGGAGMTNQGIHTVINGNIGTTAASSLITGFHDTSLPIVGAVWPCSYTETPLNKGQVNGVINTDAPPPTVNCPNEGTAQTMAIATEAALEARTAYTTLQGLPSNGLLAAELGGTTIYSGVYTNASSVAITNGDLTLDARGDPNAYWVFQIGSSLTVGDPVGPQTRSVILAGGAKASNIFWAVGGLPGAIINYGGGGTMAGTIISQPGITVSSPAQSTSATVTTINGRILALDASATIVNTVVNVPAP